MKSIYILGVALFFLPGCGDKYEFWDISKFNIKKEALKDNEEIKVLYTSRGPDSNKELQYYIHVIAVSLHSGDTVNILTTVNNGFTMEDEGKVFNYLSQDNVATKVVQMDLDEIKSIEDINTALQNKPSIDINKVARDPEYDYIADNNYPTVIGAIGTVKPGTDG